MPPDTKPSTFELNDGATKCTERTGVSFGKRRAFAGREWPRGDHGRTEEI